MQLYAVNFIPLLSSLYMLVISIEYYDALNNEHQIIQRSYPVWRITNY